MEEKKLVLSGVDRDVCGTSSAQILVGEDLDYPARKLLQQQQVESQRPYIVGPRLSLMLLHDSNSNRSPTHDGGVGVHDRGGFPGIFS